MVKITLSLDGKFGDVEMVDGEIYGFRGRAN
jgi:hypothetical protein